VLDERDRAILDFERQWWERSGAKEDAIRQTFGLSPARYYQILGAVMETAEALAYDPELVNRLQRVREERHRSRQERVNPESSGKN
jgi:hypothetical protein